MLEKEQRYAVTEEQIIKVLEVTEPSIEKKEMLDVSFYKNGENLYELYKYIVRIRQKGERKTLEIKKYKNDETTCLEGSISLDSIKDAVNFLALMDLTPGIYLKREREVRKYKSLDIFIDRFDVIGDFVEVEYQGSENALKEITEFRKECGIDGESEDMYGGIINTKLSTDDEFKKMYKEKMAEVVQSL